jgi:hypothetical protein
VRTWTPHNEAHYRASGLVLLDFWEQPCYHEVLAFKQQQIRLSVVEREGVVFLAYRLGIHPWSDVPFIFHKTPPGDEPDLSAEETEQSPLTARVVVVDAGTGIIRAARVGAVDSTFAAEMRRLARVVARAHAPGEDEFRARIERVYSLHPTSEALARQATATACIAAPGAPGADHPIEATSVN